MPRKEIDYSNTHFYKIVCKDLNIKDCYVGHTTHFTKRKHQHKNHSTDVNCKQYTVPLYEFMRNNGGFENFDMILLSTERCENVLEARKRERQYIEELNATLNAVYRPYITHEEKQEYKSQWYEKNKERCNERNKQYMEDNKEYFANYRKQWYEENKDEILDRQKEYYKQNREKKKEYQKQYASEHQEDIKDRNQRYYKANDEKIKQKAKEWREQNTERIKQREATSYECQCGSTVKLTNKARHKTSIKHQEYLNSLDN